MHSLAVRRGKAYALDCLGYLGLAAATVPLGVLTNALGGGEHQVLTQALSAIPPVLATVLAAGQESGRHRATWGKRRLGLRVAADDGAPLDLGRALLRNTAKIFVPWQVGHTLAVGAAYGGFDRGDPVTLVAAGLTYPLIGVLVTSVVAERGRGVHDRLVGSVVTAAPAPGGVRTDTVTSRT